METRADDGAAATDTAREGGGAARDAAVPHGREEDIAEDAAAKDAKDDAARAVKKDENAAPEKDGDAEYAAATKDQAAIPKIKGEEAAAAATPQGNTADDPAAAHQSPKSQAPEGAAKEDEGKDAAEAAKVAGADSHPTSTDDKAGLGLPHGAGEDVTNNTDGPSPSARAAETLSASQASPGPSAPGAGDSQDPDDAATPATGTPRNKKTKVGKRGAGAAKIDSGNAGAGVDAPDNESPVSASRQKPARRASSSASGAKRPKNALRGKDGSGDDDVADDLSDTAAEDHGAKPRKQRGTALRKPQGSDLDTEETPKGKSKAKAFAAQDEAFQGLEKAGNDDEDDEHADEEEEEQEEEEAERRREDEEEAVAVSSMPSQMVWEDLEEKTRLRKRSIEEKGVTRTLPVTQPAELSHTQMVTVFRCMWDVLLERGWTYQLINERVLFVAPGSDPRKRKLKFDKNCFDLNTLVAHVRKAHPELFENAMTRAEELPDFQQMSTYPISIAELRPGGMAAERKRRARQRAGAKSASNKKGKAPQIITASPHAHSAASRSPKTPSSSQTPNARSGTQTGKGRKKKARPSGKPQKSGGGGGNDDGGGGGDDDDDDDSYVNDSGGGDDDDDADFDKYGGDGGDDDDGTDEEKAGPAPHIKKDWDASTGKAAKDVASSEYEDDEDEDEDEELDEESKFEFKIMYPWLQQAKGWFAKQGSGLVYWHYAKPGVTFSRGKPVGKLMEDYFTSQEQVVEYVKSKDDLREAFLAYADQINKYAGKRPRKKGERRLSQTSSTLGSRPRRKSARTDSASTAEGRTSARKRTPVRSAQTYLGVRIKEEAETAPTAAVTAATSALSGRGTGSFLIDDEFISLGGKKRPAASAAASSSRQAGKRPRPGSPRTPAGDAAGTKQSPAGSEPANDLDASYELSEPERSESADDSSESGVSPPSQAMAYAKPTRAKVTAKSTPQSRRPARVTASSSSSSSSSRPTAAMPVPQLTAASMPRSSNNVGHLAREAAAKAAAEAALLHQQQMRFARGPGGIMPVMTAAGPVHLGGIPYNQGWPGPMASLQGPFTAASMHRARDGGVLLGPTGNVGTARASAPGQRFTQVFQGLKFVLLPEVPDQVRTEIEAIGGTVLRQAVSWDLFAVPPISEIERLLQQTPVVIGTLGAIQSALWWALMAAGTRVLHYEFVHNAYKNQAFPRDWASFEIPAGPSVFGKGSYEYLPRLASFPAPYVSKTVRVFHGWTFYVLPCYRRSVFVATAQLAGARVVNSVQTLPKNGYILCDPDGERDMSLCATDLALVEELQLSSRLVSFDIVVQSLICSNALSDKEFELAIFKLPAAFYDGSYKKHLKQNGAGLDALDHTGPDGTQVQGSRETPQDMADASSSSSLAPLGTKAFYDSSKYIPAGELVRSTRIQQYSFIRSQDVRIPCGAMVFVHRVGDPANFPPRPAKLLKIKRMKGVPWIQVRIFKFKLDTMLGTVALVPVDEYCELKLETVMGPIVSVSFQHKRRLVIDGPRHPHQLVDRNEVYLNTIYHVEN